MPININEEAINVVTDIIKKMIEFNQLEEALNILDEKFSPVSKMLADSILINKAQYHSLKQNISRGLLNQENIAVQEAQAKQRILLILDIVPEELQIQRLLGNIKQGIYKTTSNENLERILGPINHIVKINWLQKAIQASRSVCQVLRSDGGEGTGFICKDGYLMTNFHVLPSNEAIEKAKIVFDFEEDLLGNMRKTSEFFLESADSKHSSILNYDYTYVKIKDNPDNPLSQWGFLELDTFSDPQINDPVNIIQHPLGQTKQIALTANKIIGINGSKLLYETDTERGSSGSPVFNNNWKVIALHHAGKTEEDGGLVINPGTGEKRGANEGILIRNIAQDIGLVQ